MYRPWFDGKIKIALFKEIIDLIHDRVTGPTLSSKTCVCVLHNGGLSFPTNIITMADCIVLVWTNQNAAKMSVLKK